jgi:hypothetical protein
VDIVRANLIVRRELDAVRGHLDEERRLRSTVENNLVR